MVLKTVKMSIIHVTDSKKTGTHVDRTSFLGAKVPDEIKTMVKHLKHIDRPTFRKLLQGRCPPTIFGRGPRPSPRAKPHVSWFLATF